MPIKRRDVLKFAVAVPFVSAARAYEPPMDYARLTASEAAVAIRKGGITAEHYVAGLIEQDRKWATLNAFISRDHDALREAARAADKMRASGSALGPLHGVRPDAGEHQQADIDDLCARDVDGSQHQVAGSW